MASAQVLPSSRKQEHLEAGKRRLEEFRKKKAADRARKAAATSQPLASSVVSVNEKQALESEIVRLTDSDGAGTSDGPIEVTVSGTTLKDADAIPPSMSHYKAPLADIHVNSHDFTRPNASVAADAKYDIETDQMNNDTDTYSGSQDGVVPYVILSSRHSSIPPPSQESFSQSIPFQSMEYNTSLKDYAFTAPSPLQTKISSNASTLVTDVDFIQHNNNLRGFSLEVEQDKHFNGSLRNDFGEANFSISLGGFPSAYGKSMQTSDTIGYDSDSKSSSNHTQLLSGTSEPNSRRSRPSFLDSLNVTRASSGTSFQPTELQKESFMPGKSNGMGALDSSTFQNLSVEAQTLGHHPMTFSASSNSVEMSNIDENSWGRKHEFYSSKHNEDFAALEQHIEDLTQEKFSLQRALESSRALAESLAAENSSLTDNYNQQRSAVNQLKSDMEKLQEEIKVHLQVELESVKMEYGNAKLECDASDERAKILASEVIGLEEKALRLRSNELKLERQLENSHAEIASYKKKILILERERQDLQSTIDALKEEKKLLQSKLRKASASGKSLDISQNSGNKKDMSTSTEDLDPCNEETVDTTALIGNDIPIHPENGQSNLEVSTVHIPADQMRLIENINTLISELALEKEELMQALSSESSQCSRLKDLNNELSRKLEAQTQRLELLTAQSMANENIQARLPDSHAMQETTTYADEGDEVVERVLGWIMKLFPGGPSRRRTSKLL
ncbi:protein BLISTER isoform X1 [Ricinus communis]|uniref:protein BLISTER isoform X1 n=1 Tax=Ricinus communis TaxID=3988 RepID=UPI00201ADA7A|nr:protein BLISTER isoform X1 [Ricinus communis]